MMWEDGDLKSPFSGKELRRDCPHSFSDGDERFPIVEEIPFLRGGREKFKAEVLRALDGGDEKAALILLLQDQDDWARSAPPTESHLTPLFDNEILTLRAAMECLKYGAVADYFAYRWSDPTFLSGLDLLEWHLPANAERVFELCCGIGHYLREFALRGIRATGADVVFSKLWLARRFVTPRAKLVCADASFDFPFAEKSFDAAFCHDAFYFLPEKKRVAAELKKVTNGAILIGHAHNAAAENFSSGAAVSVGEYASMFESPILYDDAEMTSAAIANRKPRAQTPDELKNTAAICLAQIRQMNRTGGEIDPQYESFLVPTADRALQINPLLLGRNGEIRARPLYPSERYADEYAALSGYLNLSETELDVLKNMNDANDGWTDDENLLNFARRRILLDLPEKWSE